MKSIERFVRGSLKSLLAYASLALPLLAQDLGRMHQDLDLRFRPPAAAAQSKSVLGGGNPKIDPALRLVVMNSQSKSLGDTMTEARAKQIPVEAGRVAVVAAANSQADVARLSERIIADGGEVIAVVDEAVLARVPPGSIERIGAERTLEYLSPQGMLSLPPSPRASGTEGSIAQGVLLTKANLLHAKGTRGQGVKVGIIDFGFTGYKAMQAAGSLPAPKGLKAFGKDQGWDRVTVGTPHGAACAEIIHAMAPDADL